MAWREPQDRRVVFSVTMRSESTAALNATVQRLMDTITVYHSPRRKSTPTSQPLLQPQHRRHQDHVLNTSLASTDGVHAIDSVSLTTGRDSQNTKTEEGQEQQQQKLAREDSDISPLPSPLSQQQQQVQSQHLATTGPRSGRNPQVTLGGVRGPIRLPKAGRVHSRRVYLIQVSERALRQIATESAVPLHDQVGHAATSQEQEGAVEVVFELE